jgi:protein TonB
MFTDPDRKPVGRKRTVVCFLTFSLLFHAAVMVFFADSERVKERHDRVEVGLVSLPPGIAGRAGEGIVPVAPPVIAGPAPGEKVPGTPSATLAGEKAARNALAANRPPDSFRPAPASEIDAAKRASLPGREPASAESQPQFEPARPVDKIIEPLSTFADAGPPPERESSVFSGEGKASASAPLVEAIPRYDRNAPPPYPRLAREQGWEGEVLLRVLVSEAGDVRSVSVERSSEHAVLDDAALRAVRRWRFHPSRLGPTPVEGEVLVPLRFKLRDF